ncbi:PREDICTED: uncharacterized protein LOC104800770 [Tarenaya hassleriana]|uniref:uncharacterized protein LOC104800770 n=1 Tax=Tarenaya hassleriana TaxID=28532 RepID=UPI00053C743C|nr:PREDICTED: uncharacterized protein LOC104800770 [Tarenaya hassleriana]
MNDISSSPASPMEENNVGSDSDTNPEEDSPDYYQPISAVDADSDDEPEDHSHPVDGDDLRHDRLSNGHCNLRQAEHRISSIGLNGGSEQKSDSEEEEEEEMPEMAIGRAFGEDERQRRSPLTAENATRVMDAMRGISFPGTAPDWVSEVPEDRWIDHLRRLRSSIQN